MEETKEFDLVGYYHFSTKDKTSEYFVIQVLLFTQDLSANTVKSNIVNIFTTKDIYNVISKLEIGDKISVSVIPNFDTNKIHYKINI